MQHYCEIPTPKGTMRGFFHKPKGDTFPVCIIFHGLTGQKTGTKFSYVSLARMLQANGIATMRMDFLGSGESDLTFKEMTFKDELACARVILEEVLKMPTTKEVYVLGHSMGGAIASEIAKLYPNDVKKMCLWAPAYNLPEALEYLTGKVEKNKEGVYDHGGFELSHDFVEDMLTRDFYKDLDTYKNAVLVLHGTNDKTVPYAISETYCKCFGEQLQFVPITDATHNYDAITHIKQVLKETLQFFVK